MDEDAGLLVATAAVNMTLLRVIGLVAACLQPGVSVSEMLLDAATTRLRGSWVADHVHRKQQAVS